MVITDPGDSDILETLWTQWLIVNEL
jgi:hypothetical protein